MKQQSSIFTITGFLYEVDPSELVFINKVIIRELLLRILMLSLNISQPPVDDLRAKRECKYCHEISSRPPIQELKVYMYNKYYLTLNDLTPWIPRDQPSL